LAEPLVGVNYTRKNKMVRKLSLICAVAAAVLFPVSTFAVEGRGTDQGHKPSHGTGTSQEQSSDPNTHARDQTGNTVPIITVVGMPTIENMTAVMITIINAITITGTDMRTLSTGITVAGGTTA
jgi:hypothetical protein